MVLLRAPAPWKEAAVRGLAPRLARELGQVGLAQGMP